MSIQSEINRIQGLRDSLIAKLDTLINLPDTADLSDCVNAVDGITAKAAATYTPGTAAQTIPAGKYLTGAQTISGDADLVAGNIKKNVAIFGVTGTYDPQPSMQSKTVSPTTSQQTVSPDSGYDGLSGVTVNAMPTATQATPSISVSSGGLITASASQTAGYVAAGTKSATSQLTVKTAQTYTPGTAAQTIAAGRYLTGAQTISGDANLTAENIMEGVSIFGVAGTASGGGATVTNFECGTSGQAEAY